MSQSASSIDETPLERWQPFRGPFTRWPRLADAVLAIVSFALTIAIWGDNKPEGDIDLPFGAFLIFLVGNASLFWRRRHAETVHWIILAASALAMIFGYLHGPIFALAISLYNLGRHSVDDRASVTGMIAALVLVIMSEVAFSGLRPEELIELLPPFVLWYIGRRVRGRGEYLKFLQERAAYLEREREADAERAVAAERTRIARELHDIVAHQVSLMTVQAGAAKTVAATDPEAAVRAMTSVETAGRQALDELRHLLGVLRPNNGDAHLSPQPGRADLPALVEEIRRAGVEVHLALDGDDRPLPARVEIAVYRIVQEALTNVLKHAGPGTMADVRIRTTRRDVILEIEDNGVGVTGLPGAGQGITGMRERAQSLGGTLSATPRATGGFRVSAVLPISEDSN